MSSESEIVDIFIAPEHSYWHLAPTVEAKVRPMRSVSEVECVTHTGLKGDRYFGFKQDYKGQVTFLSIEVFENMCREIGTDGAQPWLARRNVLTRGVDLNQLIGRTFRIGGVRFHGVEECAPCDWMNRAIGPGARDYLKGRGGLRARILSDGVIAKGPLNLEIET